MTDGILNREQLSQKLRALNSSQQSIESTANWCLFYSREAKTIVSIWDDEFNHMQAADKKMAQLYLANHLLQEGKKKGREFGEEYSKVILKAVKAMLLVAEDKTRKSLERLVGIWDERRVFGPAVIKTLRDAIAKAKASPAPAPANTNGTHSKKSAQVPALAQVAELWTEVTKAKDKSSQHSAKALQLKPKLHLQGSMPEILAAKDVLDDCGAALQSELGARERLIEELHKLIMQQEDGFKLARTQLEHYREQQELLKNRAVVLESVAASNVQSQSPPQQQQQQQSQQSQPTQGAPGFPPVGASMSLPGQPNSRMQMSNGMPMGLPPGAFPPGMMPGAGGPLNMMLPPPDAAMLAVMAGLTPDAMAAVMGPMAIMGLPAGMAPPPMVPQQSLTQAQLPPASQAPGFPPPPPHAQQKQTPQPPGSSMQSLMSSGLANQGSAQQPVRPSAQHADHMLATTLMHSASSLPPPTTTHQSLPHPTGTQHRPHGPTPPSGAGPRPPQPSQPPHLMLSPEAVADVAKTLATDQNAAAMLAQALAAMPEEERQRLAMGLANVAHPAPPPTQQQGSAQPAPLPTPATAGEGQPPPAPAHLSTASEDMALDDDDYDPDNPF